MRWWCSKPFQLAKIGEWETIDLRHASMIDSKKKAALKILVVEDDPEIARLVTARLMAAQMVVDAVDSIGDARLALEQFCYDVAVIDRWLPDGDGIALLSMRAKAKKCRFLIITAMGEVHDRIEGLDAGADDYLAKPFDPDELLARVRSLLRRASIEQEPTLRLGAVTFAVGSATLTVNNMVLRLPRRELAILEALMRRAKRVVLRDDMINAVYGIDDEIESNTLDAQVSRLRQRLIKHGGGINIRAVRGVGYFIEETTV